MNSPDRPFSPLVALLGLVALLAHAAIAPSAIAQYGGPAGNAHPESEMVSGDSDDISNPFGERPFGTERPSPAAKAAFERALDLELFRELPVFHNGRVKVLDTLARETVSAITGRTQYVEYVRSSDDSAEPGELEKVTHDHLFTLLDLMIDPAYYVDKPLVHINYFPLREELVEAAIEDRAMSQRYLKLTRVSPLMLREFAGPIAARYAFDEPYVTAFNRVDRALGLWDNTWRNMAVVPPDSRDLPWKHLSRLDPYTPAREAATALGEAWRAGDAQAANTHAAELATALNAINPDTFDDTRAKLELAYNRSNAFEWGLWAYLASFVSLLLAFGTHRRWLVITGIGLLVAAIGLHSFGFAARCFIAERFAIQNQFESMAGLSLFATLVGTGLMLARRQWLFGAAAAAVGFMVLVTATQTPIPGKTIEREAAILNTSVLLKYHVTTVLVSYGLIALGFVTSAFFLAVHYLKQSAAPHLAAAATADIAEPIAKVGTVSAGPGSAGSSAKGAAPVKTKARLLADLDTAQMTVLQLAFWTLGVGILLGAWWADHSWGRWWAFDPKETWALITWIVYLIAIHARFGGMKNKGLVTAWLSVVGFFVMLFTYFGVNLLLPGLHAYA